MEGSEAHHMAHVLRLKSGQRVCLFDGKGTEAVGRIVGTEKDRVRIEIEECAQTDREARVAIDLAFSIPKGDRAEILVEKACELGVKRLIPIECRRSVVRLREEGSQKLNKWRRIAIEASKQCGRTYVTEVEEMTPLTSLLGETGRYGLALLATTSPTGKLLQEVIRGCLGVNSILCVVGPEGGFTEEEVEEAKEKGCLEVNLGVRVLRIETAAIAVVSMLLFFYGF